MPDAVFAAHLGTRAPILLATSGYPADIHALLGRRHPGHRLTVLGYRDPGRPHTQAELMAPYGLDDDNLWQLTTHHTPLTMEASASCPLPSTRPRPPAAEVLDAFDRDGYAIIRTPSPPHCTTTCWPPLKGSSPATSRAAATAAVTARTASADASPSTAPSYRS
jgi:hypothetical protein